MLRLLSTNLNYNKYVSENTLPYLYIYSFVTNYLHVFVSTVFTTLIYIHLYRFIVLMKLFQHINNCLKSTHDHYAIFLQFSPLVTYIH